MVTRLSKTRIHTDTSVALQGPVNYAVASGTDTYTADPSPAFTAYVTGAHYFISFTNGNTSTTPTLNLNSLGAKTIVKEGTAALVAGNIPAGHKAVLMYDGTYLVLLNPKASSTPTIQVFTSSGTWTKPSGVTKIKVTVVGGGGGGGSYSGGIYGSGGGGGGACIEYINVSAVSSETITVGAGGSASSGGAGGNGGTSSFGAYCSATGGTGGGAGLAAGGAGGVGSGGDLNIRGNPGMDSYGTNPAHGGGGSVFAGGSSAGGANATYGGGGGTGFPEGTVGAAGVIVVEEY